MTQDTKVPFTLVTAEILRRLLILGIPANSILLYQYMSIRAGGTGRFFEAKVKTAECLGKGGDSAKAKQKWFGYTVGPLLKSGLVTKLYAGSCGRTSEYSVASIEDWDDPRFEQPLVNYGRQWALESGLDVDPDAAEFLYAAIGIPITRDRFVEDLEWLSDHHDQTREVLRSKNYWSSRGLPMRGLAKEAAEWDDMDYYYD
jgi:hypothetical protein